MKLYNIKTFLKAKYLLVVAGNFKGSRKAGSFQLLLAVLLLALPGAGSATPVSLRLTAEFHQGEADAGTTPAESKGIIYVDRAIEGMAATDFPDKVSGLHLFSHGRPGFLFVEGQWLGAAEIAEWLPGQFDLAGQTHLSIYGCNFARGEKGRAALAYLENTLGIFVAASDDVTGADGDWELEAGTTREVLALPAYPGNLQGYIDCATIVTSGATTTTLNGVKVLDGKTYAIIEVPPASTTYPIIGSGSGPSSPAGTLVDSYLAVFDENCNQVIGTYIAGIAANAIDNVFDIEVDEAGNIYVSGRTESEDFVTTDGTTVDGDAVYVRKYAPDGTLLYSTVLNTQPINLDLILDNGEVFVVFDVDRPGTLVTTDGSVFSGSVSQVAVKLDAGGGLVYAVYLPSDPFGFELFPSVVVKDGCLFVGSTTTAADFPTTDGTTFSGGFTADATLVKLDPTGNRVFSTILGGPGNESGVQTLLDGNFFYLVGRTFGTGFPTTDGTVATGDEDVFIARYDLAGNLIYSTLLASVGGDVLDQAVVANGELFVVLSNDGNPFLRPDAPAGSGTEGIVVTSLADDGTLNYSTSLNGGFRGGIAVNEAGEAFLGIADGTTNVLTTDGTDGGDGIALIKLNADGSLCAASVIDAGGGLFAAPFKNGATRICSVEGDTITSLFRVVDASRIITTTDGSANGERGGLVQTRFVFCPMPTPVASDVLSPQTQEICANGLVNLIAGERIVIEGTSFPEIFVDGVPTTQADVKLAYQWQVSSSPAGPFADISGPLAQQQNYSPPPTVQDVYYRRVTKTAECCGGTEVSTSDVSSVIVGPNTAPSVMLPALSITCPGVSYDLTPEVTGGTAPFNYAWSTGETTESISVVLSETSLFGVTVTDANGCIQASQAPVQVYAADAGPDVSVCDGTPVTLGGAPLPGVAVVPEGAPAATGFSVSYTWAPAAGLSCSDCPNPVATPGTETDYTLTVMIYNADGPTVCQTTDDVTVGIVGPPATLDFAGPDVVVCNGETAELGTPAEVTVFNAVSGTASSNGPVNVADLIDGNSSTGIKTNNGATENVVLDIGAVQLVNQIALRISSNQSFDTDMMIEVSADGVTYTPIFMDVRISSAATTTVSSSSNTILAFPEVSARFFRFTSESGIRDVGISEFSAGNGYTYVWRSGEFLATAGSMATFDRGFVLDDEPLLMNPNPRTYTLTAQLNGCTFTDEVQVAIIEARAGEDMKGPTTLGDRDRTPSIGETYTWTRVDAESPGSSMFLGATDIRRPPVSASFGGPTVYALETEFMLNGAMAICRDTVIVEEFCGCNIAFDIENGCTSVDNYGPSQITAFINPADGLNPDDFDVSWSPMQGLNVYDERVVTVESNVDITYTVTFTNRFDPTFICEETIRVNDPASSIPTFNASTPVLTCGNDDPVNIGDPAADPGLEYNWSPAAGLDDPTSNFPLVTVGTTTVFTALVTNSTTGCEFTTDITVEKVGVADAGPDIVVCDNGVVTLGATALPGYTYSWAPNEVNGGSYQNGTTSTDAQPEVFVAANQQFILTTIETASNCVTTDTVDIFVFPLPPMFSLSNNDFCPSDGGPITLGFENLDASGANEVPTGAFTYNWSPGFLLDDNTVRNPVLTSIPNTPTTFTLVLEGGGGCNVEAELTITPRVATPLTGGEQRICVDEEVVLGSDNNMTGPGITYNWVANPGNPAGATLVTPTDPSPTFSSTGAGNFEYTVTRMEAGCSVEATVVVKVQELVLDPIPSPTICMGDEIQIGPEPRSGLSYEWTPATGLSDPFISNPVFSGTTSQDFTLTVINLLGCTEEIDVAVAVSDFPTPMVMGLVDETICNADELDFTLMPTVTPAADYAFSWEPTTFITGDPTTLNPTVSLPSVPGDYPLTLTVTNQMTGCNTVETVTFTYLSEDCVFDLALTKMLAAGQTSPFMIGAEAIFNITVVNQGTIDATSIDITDYLPSNTTYSATGSTASGALTTAGANTANLVNNGDGTFSIDALAAGDMVTFDIALTVGGGIITGTLTNTAEITNAVGGIDEDSPLDSVIGESDDTSELASDDDIADDSTGGVDNPADEDDYDLAQFEVVGNGPVAVGDTVWVDLNNDGLLTPGEPGLANVTVTIFDNATGMPVTLDFDGDPYVATQMTNADGGYFFENLPPGDYYVVFDISTGDNAEFYDFTTQNTGGNDELDSDANPATGQSDPTGPLDNDEVDRTLDAGVVCIVAVTVAEPASICSTQSIDLTVGASVTPTSLTATWSTPDGSLSGFDGGTGFGTATTYTPTAADIQRGSVTLVLTTDDPAGPCEVVSAMVTFTILNVDCGSFPWGGE